MTVNKIILPIIRNVMPDIIARDLLGVQPMTGQIFNKSSLRGDIFMNKEHFRHFLRVYNRKKFHSIDDVAGLGYPMTKIDISNTIQARQWCRKNLKPGSFVSVNARFCFAYERDYTLFILRWG